MTELTYDDYTYHAYTTAFFKDEVDAEEQSKIVFYGYQEEVGELLTDETYPEELTSKLWGLPVSHDASDALDHNKTSEAGDVLYFIAAAGMIRNISLREMMKAGLERYTGQTDISGLETFSHFDHSLRNNMGEPVPLNYRPNYHTWKVWDFAPFEDTLDIVMSEPTYAKGPLRLIGDGRYALDRLHSTFGRFMLPETSNEEEFISAAGLVLGGLSIVLQNRFNSSLEVAARNNINKRERRLAAHTLRHGKDEERSRLSSEPRPTLSAEESTYLNLLNADLPPERSGS